MGRGFSFVAFVSCAAALAGACISPVSVSLGSNDAGLGADAAPALCLYNPMFTGSPTDDGGIPRGSRTSTRLPGWQSCNGHVDINPGVCSLAAPPGSMTYVGLDVGGFQGTFRTSLSTPLVPPVPPGSYPFSIDLGVATAMTLSRGGFGAGAVAQVELRIYGSATPCGMDEELARLGPITNMDTWASYSGTLTAHQMFSNLVLVPMLRDVQGVAPQREVYVVVGNFGSQACH